MYRHEPAFQVDGIASGYRTKDLIEAAAKSQEGPLRRAVQRYDTFVHQVVCFQQVLGGVNALRDITSLTPDASVLAPPTVLTGTPLVTGQASPGAVLGKYTLQIKTIAAAQRTYSESWASQYDSDKKVWVPAQPLAAGTLTVTLASGTSRTTPLGNGVAQADVASSIIGMGLSISAQIIDDSAHTPPRQTMMLSGLTQGSTMGFTVAASYTSPQAAGTNALNFASYQSQAAADSEVQIDGRPDTITSASQEVAGALPGVSLRLNDGAAPGLSTYISVAPDQISLRQGVDNFLTAWNHLLTILYRVTQPPALKGNAKNAVEAREQAAFRKRTLAGTASADASGQGDRREKDAVTLLKTLLGQQDETAPEGVENLRNDRWTVGLHEQLLLTFGNAIAGVAEFGCLRDVGVQDEVDAYGTRSPAGAQSLDDEAFTSAAAAAPAAVAQLFAGNITTGVKGMFDMIENLLAPPAEPDPANPGRYLEQPDTVSTQLQIFIQVLQQQSFLAQAEMRQEHERLERYKANQAQRLQALEKNKGRSNTQADYLTQVAESLRNK